MQTFAEQRCDRRKLANLKDVAEYVGMSVSTVSRVLNDKAYVDPSTRRIVLAAVEELGYRPNALARSLKIGRTYTIALLIPDIQNLYLTMIVRGVEDAARQEGLTVILCNTDENTDIEAEYINVLRDRWVDGFVISSISKKSDSIRRLKNEGYPMVLTVRYYDYLSGIDTVAVDNFNAAYQAVKYLYELGHRQIGLVLGDIGLNVYKDRFAGYREALRDFDLPLNERIIIKNAVDGSEALIHDVEMMVNQPTDCPDAIFATSDLKAISVMHALHKNGKQIPEDISVMGFDDIPLSSLVHPTLTTMKQPLYEIGQLSVQKLISQIEAKATNGQHIHSIELLPTEIISRQSTRRRSECL